MTEQTYKPGDLVRLKSGGPVMTFEGESQFFGSICTWFEGSDRKRDTFSPVTLEPATRTVLHKVVRS